MGMKICARSASWVRPRCLVAPAPNSMSSKLLVWTLSLSGHEEGFSRT